MRIISCKNFQELNDVISTTKKQTLKNEAIAFWKPGSSFELHKYILNRFPIQKVIKVISFISVTNFIKNKNNAVFEYKLMLY